VVGTADDNVRLSEGSPCIDAGDNGAVPADVEIDLAGNARFLDDPGTTDTGMGTAPIVDFGAYEFDGVSCLADVSDDGLVNIDDLFAVLSAWGPCSDCPEDITSDGQVNIDDLFEVLGRWGPCS
jgi:hypothetical protein